MRKNTRFWQRATTVVGVILGIINAIGIVADLFGFADGISEHSSAFRNALTFLAARWKWMIGITAAMLAVILYFRWKKKKEMEEMETRVLSWFDAKRRNTAYMGSLENRYQLKKFLLSRDEMFSWWAVTGVAGIGKTRLAIEVERLDEFRSADVQWLKHFEDYREDALKQKVDSMLESRNFRNILIADDAQLYMDNIGALIEYIYRKNAEDIGDHRIRLLLLMRMGEDEDLSGRFKQLETKAATSTLRKTKYGDILAIEKYSEEDVAEIVRSYAEVTAKKRNIKNLSEEQLSDMKEKAVGILKSERVDPRHLRPLFAMFITDALLAGKDPMSWDRKDILEYAVGEREDELLMWEIQDAREGIDGQVYDKVRGIVSLAIIKDGIELSDLEGIREDLEKELNLAGISMKDFLINIQLLAEDGIIQIYMPDILAEYYVLRTLVVEADNNREVIRWVISRLVQNMDGVPEFREKVRQDFRYIYDDSVNESKTIGDKLEDFYHAYFKQCSEDLTLDILKRLLAQLDLQDSNAIILHEAIQSLTKKGKAVTGIAETLRNLICFDELDKEEKRTCLGELRRLSEANAENEEIVVIYIQGLVNMIHYDPGIEEKRKHLVELRSLAEENAGNEEIVHEYSKGLINMIHNEPGIEGKRKHLGELRRLSEANAENEEIVVMYSQGLRNMIIGEPGIEGKREHLEELHSLAEANARNEEIVHEYSKGLVNVIHYEPGIEEKRKHLGELRSLAEENAGMVMYSQGLFSMINYEPGIEGKRERLGELHSLAEKNARNAEIVVMYSRGLCNMLLYEPGNEEKRKHFGELRSLTEEYARNAEIVFIYSHGLFNMIIHDPGIEEKRKYLGELQGLSKTHAENILIALEYSRGLFYMHLYDSDYFDNYIAELYRLLSDKKFARYVAKEEPTIITQTRRVLLDYEQQKGIM